MADYSVSGDHLNALLRDDELDDDSPLRSSMVGPLDQLTRHRLSTPLDVVRGVDYDALPPDIDPGDVSRLRGEVLEDPGFMSATVRDVPPGKFRDRPVYLRIHLSPGTCGARLDRYGSEFAAEREVLLARGTSMMVREVYRDNDRWILNCEVLPDE